MLASPPGETAPPWAINYTPQTGEVHDRGRLAPIDAWNYSLVPTNPRKMGGMVGAGQADDGSGDDGGIDQSVLDAATQAMNDPVDAPAAPDTQAAAAPATSGGTTGAPDTGGGLALPPAWANIGQPIVEKKVVSNGHVVTEAHTTDASQNDITVGYMSVDGKPYTPDSDSQSMADAVVSGKAGPAHKPPYYSPQQHIWLNGNTDQPLAKADQDLLNARNPRPAGGQTPSGDPGGGGGSNQATSDLQRYGAEVTRLTGNAEAGLFAMAQAMHETGGGNKFPMGSQGPYSATYNYAAWGGVGDGSAHPAYNTPEEGAQGYVNWIKNNSNYQPTYAAMAGGGSVQDIANTFATTSAGRWAEDGQRPDGSNPNYAQAILNEYSQSFAGGKPVHVQSRGGDGGGGSGMQSVGGVTYSQDPDGTWHMVRPTKPANKQHVTLKNGQTAVFDPNTGTYSDAMGNPIPASVLDAPPEESVGHTIGHLDPDTGKWTTDFTEPPRLDQPMDVGGYIYAPKGMPVPDAKSVPIYGYAPDGGAPPVVGQAPIPQLGQPGTGQDEGDDQPLDTDPDAALKARIRGIPEVRGTTPDDVRGAFGGSTTDELRNMLMPRVDPLVWGQINDAEAGGGPSDFTMPPGGQSLLDWKDMGQLAGSPVPGLDMPSRNAQAAPLPAGRTGFGQLPGWTNQQGGFSGLPQAPVSAGFTGLMPMPGRGGFSQIPGSMQGSTRSAMPGGFGVGEDSQGANRRADSRILQLVQQQAQKPPMPPMPPGGPPPGGPMGKPPMPPGGFGVGKPPMPPMQGRPPMPGQPPMRPQGAPPMAGMGQDDGSEDILSPVNPAAVQGTGNKFGQPVSMEGTHKGTDLQAIEGTPVQAPASGVVHIKHKKGLGLQVTITDSKGVTHELGHLLAATVKNGQRVKKGETVGQVGQSGTGATGPHLDYRAQNQNGDYLNSDQMLGPLSQLPESPNTVRDPNDPNQVGTGADYMSGPSGPSGSTFATEPDAPWAGGGGGGGLAGSWNTSANAGNAGNTGGGALVNAGPSPFDWQGQADTRQANNQRFQGIQAGNANTYDQLASQNYWNAVQAAMQPLMSGTWAQNVYQQQLQSALQNPWLQSLSGMAPGWGTPGGPQATTAPNSLANVMSQMPAGWTDPFQWKGNTISNPYLSGVPSYTAGPGGVGQDVGKGQAQPQTLGSEPSATSWQTGSNTGNTGASGGTAPWTGGSNVSQYGQGFAPVNWSDWSNMSPYQQAGWLGFNMSQGYSMPGTFTNEQQYLANSGGPTAAPITTQQQMGQMSPLDQMRWANTQSLFGRTPQQSLTDLQRQWSMANAGGVSGLGWA